jgi:adenylosuccinate lyase
VAVSKKTIHEFIDRLKIPAALKKELKSISPHNYTGMPLR